MAKLIKDRDGKTLYPLCGFQKSQHKLYYWYDKAYLNMVDSDYEEKAVEEYEFWSNAGVYFTNCINGLIYVPGDIYNRLKEAIVMYDIRH